MAWSLRRAEPKDAEALIEIIVEGFEGYRSIAPGGWEPPDERRRVEEFRDAIAAPATFTLIAEDAGLVHWVPLGDPVDLHLRYMFVRPAHWGTGLAAALMRAAVQAMEGRSARLFTPAGQARARRFYEREGWSRAAEPPDDRGFGMPLVEYRYGGCLCQQSSPPSSTTQAVRGATASGQHTPG